LLFDQQQHCRQSELAMPWKKVPEAAKDWAGGVSAKTLYSTIKTGKLRAARIGAGRNVLVSEEFVSEWLMNSAKKAGADDA